MLVLAALGVALVLFGGWLLVKMPERPGGKLALGKVEVSSAGAGLPLVVLGVVCVVLSASGDLRGMIGLPPDKTPTPTPTTSPTPTATATPPASPSPASGDCLQQYVAAIPTDLVASVEERALNVRIIEPAPAAGEAFVIKFTEERAPLGAIKLSLYENNGKYIFKITSVVDAACQPASYRVIGAGDQRTLHDWDTIRINFGGIAYEARIGYRTGIELNYFKRASR
ncbi:MAG TPA: hypothetical protein VGX24_11860 [Pyrinomonadaceae bacterium]|jgi:hypothetical protein|nr:hypothetical protein [Pyrinomonadaceae bacterium]